MRVRCPFCKTLVFVPREEFLSGVWCGRHVKYVVLEHCGKKVRLNVA